MAKYDLNDLQSDVCHLSHLVETAHDVLSNECHFVVPEGFKPGDRLPSMERFASLLWIARDLAATIDKTVDENFRVIGSTCATVPKASSRVGP